MAVLCFSLKTKRRACSLDLKLLFVYGKENIWYKKSPLAKNEVGQLLSEAAENNGLQGRSANYSVRKTWISRLLNLYEPGNYIAHLNDYPNLKILDSYKSPSVQHQQRMSFTLSPSANVRATRASSSSFTSFVDIHQKEQSQSFAVKSDKLGIFHGDKFENCSFKIQVMNGSVTKMASKTETSRKQRLILKKAISWAGVQSFTGFSVQMW